MSTVCDVCGASNRATAMFCIGCTGQLPGFVASGPSALDAMSASGADVRSGRGTSSMNSSVFWQRLVLLGLVLIIGFTGWYLYVALEGTGKAPPEAATGATEPEIAPLRPIVPMPARSSTAEPGTRTGEVAAADVPAPSEPAAVPLAGAAVQGETAAETVAKFYRALSVGDGATATAIVVPEKRGVGAFNETNIAKFYGSFKEPLSLRSIRQIDRNVVEAKYTYRASSIACDGTAIVRTELVRRQTLIRSIRANC